MARDFLGLNSKDPIVVVKEEVIETSMGSEYRKGSGAPWPASSKVSALPHFTSFKVAQDEKPPKLMSDHHGPPGFMAVPSSDGYDLNNKRLPAEVQTVQSSPLSHDVKMPPYSMGNPFFKTLFAGSGQNFTCATAKQQILGGIPVTNPHSSLSGSGFLAGTTEPLFNAKVFGAPAQLTIFYAGTVHVYDDISPEKAQAIMFLAGNGCNNFNVPLPKVQAQASADNDEIKASKTLGISSCNTIKVETPNIMSSLGAVPASSIMPSAVPQARKASLARFLEMRKERVMNSSPYRLSKKSAENANPESNGANFSPTSGAGSNSISTGKESCRDV